MTTPETQENKKLMIAEKSISERFMLKVIDQFGSSVGEVALTKFQKRLAQNYFMAIDDALQKAEAKRLKKTGKYQDQTPATWANVNMESLSRNVVASARVGLDPNEKNHIFPVLFKNNNTRKYDVGFIIGYRGLEIKVYKYGLDIPDAVIVEVVYSTDKFRSVKKDGRNKIESFEFEITNDFDRGQIVGGFFYHEFNDHPEKNKLKVFSLKDILKRKPQYASADFWGGEKDIWKDGKKTGEKEQTEGWYEDMVRKTIIRAAYSAITIDSQKIDDDYQALSSAELSAGVYGASEELRENTEANANKDFIEIEQEEKPVPEKVDPKTGEIKQPVEEQAAEDPSF